MALNMRRRVRVGSRQSARRGGRADESILTSGTQAASRPGVSRPRVYHDRAPTLRIPLYYVGTKSFYMRYNLRLLEPTLTGALQRAELQFHPSSLLAWRWRVRRCVCDRLVWRVGDGIGRLEVGGHRIHAPYSRTVEHA